MDPGCPWVPIAILELSAPLPLRCGFRTRAGPRSCLRACPRVQQTLRAVAPATPLPTRRSRRAGGTLGDGQWPEASVKADGPGRRTSGPKNMCLGAKRGPKPQLWRVSQLPHQPTRWGLYTLAVRATGRGCRPAAAAYTAAAAAAGVGCSPSCGCRPAKGESEWDCRPPTCPPSLDAASRHYSFGVRTQSNALEAADSFPVMTG